MTTATRRSTLRLEHAVLALLLGLLVPGLVAADTARDYVLWSQTPSGMQSVWVSVDGKTITTRGTRNEIVVVRDNGLWAVRTTDYQQPLYPCEAIDDPKSVKASKQPRQSVAAHPLAGGEPQVLVPKETSDYFGDVWNQNERILGSFGPVIFGHHLMSGYECGAHGYVYDNRYVHRLGGDRVSMPRDLLSADKAVVKALGRGATAVEKETRKNECWDEDESDVQVDGLELLARNGKPTLRAWHLHEPSASWAHNCFHEGSVEVPLTALMDAETAADLERLAAQLKLNGNFGLSRIRVSPDALKTTLARFTDKTTVPTPPPSWTPNAAKKHLADGRRLTREKKYAEAIAAFDAAIAADANHGRAWSGRGYARYLAGQYAAARADFRNALNRDSDSGFQAAVWFNLGLVAEKLGERDNAITAYERALSIKKSKAAQKRLDALKRTRK